MIRTLFLLLAACGKSGPVIEPQDASAPSGLVVTDVEPESTEVEAELPADAAVCLEECLRANMASPLPAERIRQDCDSSCSGERDLLGGWPE